MLYEVPKITTLGMSGTANNYQMGIKYKFVKRKPTLKESYTLTE